MTRAEETASPLERLKQRNAETRWQELKESLRKSRPQTGEGAGDDRLSVDEILGKPESSILQIPASPVEAVPPKPATVSNRKWEPVPIPVVDESESTGASTDATRPNVSGFVAPQSKEAQPEMPVANPAPHVSVVELPQPTTTTAQRVPPNSVQPAPIAKPQTLISSPAVIPLPTSTPQVAEATTPPTSVRLSPEHATSLPQPRTLAPEVVFLPEADGNPLLVPNPEAFTTSGASEAGGVVELAEPEGRIAVPPAPISLAQSETLPLPLPQDDADLFALRPITEIEPFHDYSPSGRETPEDPNDPRSRRPELKPLPPTGSLDRVYAPTQFQWEAANVYHNPLYFEDVELERYGHAYPYGLQPVASLAKFGVQTIGLPYLIAMDPVWQKHYALGYYRPGDCAPKLHYQIPLDKKAALTAAGVYTGLFFIFP
ncbi:MAG: hypothetical protein KDA58_11710 [Planctomycetaceae bacterium]|nr:hypothetical protein [Planctomycetaceae bacterium]